MPYAQNIVLNLAHLPEYFNATLTLLLTQHWDYRNQHLNFIEVKVQFFYAFVFECLQVTSVKHLQINKHNRYEYQQEWFSAGHHNQKIMAYVACSEIGTVGGKTMLKQLTKKLCTGRIAK